MSPETAAGQQGADGTFAHLLATPLAAPHPIVLCWELPRRPLMPYWADIASLPNTVVIDRSLSYAETLSLHASCDVYGSLHRAEGLRLNRLNAMSLGRPVIATAWSGNMDCMTPEDSCLVDLVPVRASHYADRPAAIGPDPVWAKRLAGRLTTRAAR